MPAASNDHSRRLASCGDSLTAAESLAAAGQWLACMRAIEQHNDGLAEAVAALCVEAIKAGIDPVAIAAALDIPVMMIMSAAGPMQ